jgi:hypothetical protein
VNLPADYTRCVGRFGLGPDDPSCPLRSLCARHRAMDADRERWPGGYPSQVSVATGLCRNDRASFPYLIPVAP